MFPTDLVDLPNPDPKAPTNSPLTPLSGSISQLNAVVEALQAKVGVDGSAVSGSIDARMADVEAAAVAGTAALSVHAAATAPHTPAATRNALHSSIAYTPSGIGWDYTKYPISPSITVVGGKQRRGSAGITPEALFDLFSVARTAPTTTYYVDIATGSDAANGLTSGTQLKSINRAVELGNATGAPYKVLITPGTYSRLYGFLGSAAFKPTQDAAFIAVGGLVVCSTHDTYSAPSLDGTYTNCYAVSMTNVTNVLNLSKRLPNGVYDELLNVATAAICNVRPGTWALVGGICYINRADGVAVTETNTRLLRLATCVTPVATNTPSCYIGSDDGTGRWEFYGSDTIAQIRFAITTPGASSNEAFVFKNASFLHAGGFGTTAANATLIDSFPGIVAFFDCSAINSAKDLYSYKNSYNATAPVGLTVNCYGENAGRQTNISCNAWTLHHNSLVMDIAGYYSGTAGGAVHNIQTSKAALIGTHVENDVGDIHSGGSVRATAIRAAESTMIDCYAVSTFQPFGGMHYHGDESSAIRLFNGCTWPARAAGNVDASGN